MSKSRRIYIVLISNWAHWAELEMSRIRNDVETTSKRRRNGAQIEFETELKEFETELKEFETELKEFETELNDVRTPDPTTNARSDDVGGSGGALPPQLNFDTVCPS